MIEDEFDDLDDPEWLRSLDRVMAVVFPIFVTLFLLYLAWHVVKAWPFF